ncbi:PP2C family serine/threonine-protein phosphatase [Mangrovibacillus cuniculi]|uniref:SpoIIE family protein phosphatase n=1 Tax=Mangrovibacillus cuniculi TaxID=2593652 RepID=A0A7S8CDW7_9BACI|nr:PP2C family serine/threonine-protein phosphatase [Mangrovibacillus cuniculi]QPC48197.1 SpoIIE family protein phosphatase [Mangrovibacillus cuniculi]
MTRTKSTYVSGPAHIYAHQQNKLGQMQCGDRYAIITRTNFSLFVIADGLGSGPGAAESSRTVIDVIKGNADIPLDQLVKECNHHLLYKRGAALAIMKLWHDSKRVEYVSIGNVRLYIYPTTGKVIYPLSTTGYLSGRPFPYKVHTMVLDEGTRFLLYSDGFQFPSSKLVTESPLSFEITVNDLFTRYATEKDDATLLAGIM